MPLCEQGHVSILMALGGWGSYTALDGTMRLPSAKCRLNQSEWEEAA
jgi:hypothetical protein